MPTEPEGPVAAISTLVLRRPYTVVRFRYDMLRLANEEDEYGLDPRPHPKALLLQRNWQLPKRSRAFDLDNHPLLAALTGAPLTLLDAGAELPYGSHGFVRELVESLHERQIVHLILPTELRQAGRFGRDGTDAPTARGVKTSTDPAQGCRSGSGHGSRTPHQSTERRVSHELDH
ncbi:hypothetical protein [Streptomyces sp. NPDC005538]|uniref:hypothetical protein n=1 Tax=unclassified Streptomyces TaxID=2593676 RepID=UPI0033B84237